MLMDSSTLLTRVKTLLDSNTATDSATLFRDKYTQTYTNDARRTELTKKTTIPPFIQTHNQTRWIIQHYA